INYLVVVRIEYIFWRGLTTCLEHLTEAEGRGDNTMRTRAMWIAVQAVVYINAHVEAQTRTEFVQALLTDYDSRIPPNFEKKTPTVVNLRLYINSIDSINEQTMDFTVDASCTRSGMTPGYSSTA
ncbi:hypothetical protein ScPMuIL_016667, partial [Solemya velum]